MFSPSTVRRGTFSVMDKASIPAAMHATAEAFRSDSDTARLPPPRKRKWRNGNTRLPTLELW